MANEAPTLTPPEAKPQVKQESSPQQPTAAEKKTATTPAEKSGADAVLTAVNQGGDAKGFFSKLFRGGWRGLTQDQSQKSEAPFGMATKVAVAEPVGQLKVLGEQANEAQTMKDKPKTTTPEPTSPDSQEKKPVEASPVPVKNLDARAVEESQSIKPMELVPESGLKIPETKQSTDPVNLAKIGQELPTEEPASAPQSEATSSTKPPDNPNDQLLQEQGADAVHAAEANLNTQDIPPSEADSEAVSAVKEAEKIFAEKRNETAQQKTEAPANGEANPQAEAKTEKTAEEEAQAKERKKAALNGTLARLGASNAQLEELAESTAKLSSADIEKFLNAMIHKQNQMEGQAQTSESERPATLQEALKNLQELMEQMQGKTGGETEAGTTQAENPLLAVTKALIELIMQLILSLPAGVAPALDETAAKVVKG